MTRLLIATLAIFFCCTPQPKVTSGFDTVIFGGRVMDPESGTDEVMNVGITDGVIVMVSKDSLSGQENIDARGLVVSPGFIDLHCHGMDNGAFALMVQDGVTSGFELELGTEDVAGWYEEHNVPSYVNYGVSVGHIRCRMQVLNDPGEFLPSGSAKTLEANEEQVEEIKSLINKGLDEGGLAVGFGLAYTPSATYKEFISVLSVAAERGAAAHIHIREGIEGLEEVIRGAEETGASVHVVHINSSGGPRSADYVALVEKAQADGLDVTTEAYPYEAGMTRIESSLFDNWENYTDEQYNNHQWVATGERLTRETFAKYRAQGGEVIRHTRTDAMTRDALNSPVTMIASDGFFVNGVGHPRTTGTFSKILGKYVREEKLYDLMDALRRMTIEPAKRLEKFVPSMKDKGRIRIGADADITVFDPDDVKDQATYVDPTLTSKGIVYVFVGGGLTVNNGQLVGDAKFGKAIRNQPVNQ